MVLSNFNTFSKHLCRCRGYILGSNMPVRHPNRSTSSTVIFKERFETTPKLRRSLSNQSKQITPMEDVDAAIRAASLRLSSSGINQGKNERFKVTQVEYHRGRMSTIQLPPAEILKRTSILPRDLVSLHLTSREEQFNRSKRRLLRPPIAILPRTDCMLQSTPHSE